METVTSRDGTSIAFWRSGTGPPLLLVHGATADHTTTWPCIPRLTSSSARSCAFCRPDDDYCSRNASIGSTRAAFQAGINPAMKATAASTTAAPTYTSGSAGCVP